MKAKEIKRKEIRQNDKARPINLSARIGKTLPIKRSGGCCGR